uniref:ABC transporter permease n=1 Tax=Gongylonema pulchrum TaxID=637853 RepID=A0A183F1L1_9BILA
LSRVVVHFFLVVAKVEKVSAKGARDVIARFSAITSRGSASQRLAVWRVVVV